MSITIKSKIKIRSKRSERVHRSQQQGRLITLQTAAAVVEDILVRPIVAELSASEKTRRPLDLVGRGHFLDVLRGASRSPVGVGEVLAPQHEGGVAGQLTPR